MLNQFIKLKPLINLKRNWLLGLLMLLGSAPVWALSNDVEKPVTIESDSVVFNKQTGSATYAGNVEIAQGTLKITASRIEIVAPNNEMQTIRATGVPVKFQQTMDNGRQAVGNARLLQYFVLQKRLVLAGEARLIQDRDTFTSNRIEYSIATGELKAGNIANKNKGQPQQPAGRVKAIFYPSNKAR
ncbi:MAG: lipopolysaccharide transport periplasmic protein LptA [Proteobacteria bacterium]|nr:MAG: lipopolysaccharide transport periplasmic protein LptA [Pseudomonadota bacterium]